MPCPVMRGSLRFLPEGSGKFEMVGHARDGEEEVVVWAVRADCWMTSDTDYFGESQRVRTVAKQLRHQLGDDADHPAYIPHRAPLRLPDGAEGRGRNRETESSDSSVWAEPRRRRRPSGLAIIVGWWALGEPHRAPSHISKTVLSTVKIGPTHGSRTTN